LDPKRDEIGGWREMHNEDLHNLCTLPKIITMMKLRRVRWVEHVVSMEDKMNAYMILIGKSKGKRPTKI
jgi:hypothetical protein